MEVEKAESDICRREKLIAGCKGATFLMKRNKSRQKQDAEGKKWREVSAFSNIFIPKRRSPVFQPVFCYS